MTETGPAPGALEHRRSTSCREGFRGVVIEPSSAEYDQTRAVFTACSIAARDNSASGRYSGPDPPRSASHG